MARLVLFTVCLAVAGSILAGVHYYAVDLPQQKLPVPENNLPIDAGCKICESNCYGKTDYYDCMTECDLIC
jgi:hypothetical protein